MSNPLTDAQSVSRPPPALLRRVRYGFVLATLLTPTRVPEPRVVPARPSRSRLVHRLPEPPVRIEAPAPPRRPPRRAADPGAAAGYPDRARAPGPRGSGPAREVGPGPPGRTGHHRAGPQPAFRLRAPRPPGEVTRQMGELLEVIQDPEAEINVVVGRSKLVQTRQPLSRIAIANPAVADVVFIADQPDPRVFNLYGRSFGTTSLTLWDAKPAAHVPGPGDARHPRRRVAAQADLPRRDVHVRQVGMQVILEGQVPDSKTMSEVLNLSPRKCSGAAASGWVHFGNPGWGVLPVGRKPARWSTARRDGNRGKGGEEGGAGMAPVVSPRGWHPEDKRRRRVRWCRRIRLAARGPIINRVVVPGPRQVMLKVKIAELNRTAIRELGMSWLNTRNKAILGSTIGNAAASGSGGESELPPSDQSSSFIPEPSRRAPTGRPGSSSPSPRRSTRGRQRRSTRTAQLFGIFNAGQFSLFINALRSNSLAKILAEPTLMTLDGQPARFIAGGQFPYPVPQAGDHGGAAVVTIEFNDFGAILSFFPNILANDVIRLDVEPVFSQLNFGRDAINGGPAPAIIQRRPAPWSSSARARPGDRRPAPDPDQRQDGARPGPGRLADRRPLVQLQPDRDGRDRAGGAGDAGARRPDGSEGSPPRPGRSGPAAERLRVLLPGPDRGEDRHEFRATIREHDPLDVMKHFRSEGHWVIGPHGHCE